MYIIEKTNISRYCDIKEDEQIILRNSEIRVIGEIKSVKRFVKESCFNDFEIEEWRKGVIKDMLFFPQNKSTVIKITYNNNEVENIPLDMNKDYKLFTDSGELIDELVPLGVTINEMLLEDDIELDDTTC